MPSAVFEPYIKMLNALPRVVPGLGYLIHQAEGTFDTTGVFAGMAILALFVLVIDGRGGRALLLSAARAHRSAWLLQGAGAQRRDQRFQGRLAVADGTGRRLGRCGHRRL